MINGLEQDKEKRLKVFGLFYLEKQNLQGTFSSKGKRLQQIRE